MRKLVAFILLSLFFIPAKAQDRGIGLRLGIPMGITYKKYLAGNKAIELGLGTEAVGWHYNYYRNAFHHLDRYEDFKYRHHYVRSTVFLQGRYELQYPIPIEGMIGKLEWYWGVGGLLKLANVDYRYSENGTPDLLSDVRTDIDLGPEGMIGMEYTFEDAPVTLFGEVSLLIEIADQPGMLRGFSGLGARYNF